MNTALKLKKGDTVAVIRGKDRGKSGKISRVYPLEGKVIVEGVNEKIRHTRPRGMGKKGQRVTILHPVRVSNVQVVCPHCKKRTRVGYQIDQGSKTRVCKKCKGELS